MKVLNAAIIGCGAIFSNHAEAIISSNNSRLYAVCDVDGKKAEEAARKFDCRCFSEYRELLKDKNIDVVHICTPHYLHSTMAIEAMKSGKHVLTEKPMATSTADALEMVRISEKTEKCLGICFQNRYNATSRRIKEVLDSGKTGRVLGAKAFVTWHRGEKYYSESDWRGTWEKEGGGVLINQAIHTLDLIQWFLGDMDGLKAHVDTRLLSGVIEVEDTADATIRFKSGVTGLFYATNCYAANSPVEMEILCEKAVIKLSDGLTITYSDGRTECVFETDKKTGEKAYWGCSHRYLIHDFYDKLVHGAKFSIQGREGITVLKMIEAIYNSSKMGCYIELHS